MENIGNIIWNNFCKGRRYMEELKVKAFSSSNELCKFVNEHEVEVETIVVFNEILLLFYWSYEF